MIGTPKYLLLIATLLLCCSCASYQISSDPQNAIVKFKSPQMIAWEGLAPSKTPCKITKGLSCPYGFDYVGVKWPDGTMSEWRPLGDQHFVKNPIAKNSLTNTPSMSVIDYDFNASTRNGFISVDISKTGIGIREQVVKKIGHICSSSNIALAAGEEELTAGGRYQILSEKVENNILTITFQAVY